MYSSILTTTVLAATALSTLVLSAPTLDKRQNPENTCHSDKGLVNSYTISLTDDRSIDVNCGGGILDNVRGRCGGSAAVTGWGCDYNGDTGAIMHFTTSAACTGGDISAALLAAGGPSLVCS